MDHDQAYFKIVNEDKILISCIESSASIIPKEPDNEKFFYYWIDDDLEIRSCHECHYSEFKSKDDGEWIFYFSRKKLLWAIERFEKGEYSLKCNLCDEHQDWKWNNYKDKE